METLTPVKFKLLGAIVDFFKVINYSGVVHEYNSH